MLKIAAVKYFRDKKTRQLKPPRSQVTGNARLELDLRANLDLPWRVDKVTVGVGDGAKQWVESLVHVEVEARCGSAAGHGAARGCNVARGYEVTGGIHAGDILLVGDVEDVTHQFHGVLLPDLETLGQANITDPVVGLAERVATDV